MAFRATTVTPHIESILDAIRRAAERRTPTLIAIDGPSGAGKSTVAAAIATAIAATVIPSDDFFAASLTSHDWDVRSPEERARDAIDWRRLRGEALEPLRAGQPVEWHPFDFAGGLRADGTYGMSSDVVRRAPMPVLILEGAYSSRAELHDLIDLTILIDSPIAVRHARLAAREDPAFLAAWHARWDAAEVYYFTHLRPRHTFDLVVDSAG